MEESYDGNSNLREWYLQEFKDITQRMFNTTKKKNNDYSSSSGPFDNFMAVESLDIASTEQGFLTRMTDKFMRIKTFVKKGVLQVTEEGVEDTLIDLANYCILLTCYIRAKRKGYLNEKE